MSLETRSTVDENEYCALCDQELFECAITGCGCSHAETEIEPGAFRSWRDGTPLLDAIERLEGGH